MGFEVNNPFIYQLREGSIADPFVDKVETIKVVDGRLLLSEMPVKQNGVLIDGHTEIDTNTPTGTQFYVDYTNGTVYFVSTKNTTVTARYKGRGIVQIPSERVYHKKGSVTRTLDAIVETVDTSAQSALNAASYAIQKGDEANAATIAVIAQNSTSKKYGDFAKEQGDYSKAQGDYAKSTADSVFNQLNANSTAADTARKAATDADNARAGVLNSIAQVTNQGTLAGQAAAQATSQADYAKAQGDYAKAQGDAAKAAVVGTITNKAVTSVKLDDDVQVGSLKTLKTDTKTSVTGALNEVFEDVTKSVLGGKMTSTTLANFIGKVGGSVTANPHIARRTSGTNTATYSSLLPPASAALQEFTTAENSLISILDGTPQTMQVPSGSNAAMAQQQFSFNLIEQIQRQYGITLFGTTTDKVSWLKSNLSKLTFNWHGYGSSPSGNKASATVWYHQFQTYEAAKQVHSNASITRLTVPIVTSSGLSAVIDNNGFVHFLAHADACDNATSSIINTDHVELIVELKTDILSSLPVATSTASGLMSASDKVKSDNSQLWALTNSSGSGKSVGGDLNKVVTSGFYNVLSTDLNGLDMSGSLIVSTRGASIIFQLFHLATNILYTRVSQDLGSTWSLWRKSVDTNLIGNFLFGNKFVDQTTANFVGKVTGSNGVNPHIAKRGAPNSLTNPVTNTPILSELINSSEYDGISSLNGSTTVSGGSSTALNAIGQQLFSYNLIEHVQRTYGTIPGTTTDKVTWLKQNISKMTLNWYGYGFSATGNKATISMWHSQSNAWYGGIPTTAGTVSKVQRTVPTQADINAVIDSNGFVHFLAYADPSDGTTGSVINTDYTELTVELSTDILSNLSVATTSSSGAMSAADKTVLDNAQKWKLTADNGRAKENMVSDLDTISASGTSFTTSTTLNMPPGVTYALVETYFADSSNNIIQRATNLTTNTAFVRTRTSSGWRTWQKSSDNNTLGNVLFGNKLVDQSNANFVGKVAGSTTANPHTAGYSVSTSIMSNPSATSEDTQAHYNSLSSIDGSLRIISSTSQGSISQNRYTFNLIEHVQRTYGTIPGVTTADKVAWLKSNLSKLTFNWFGFGSSPAGNKANLAQWYAGNGTPSWGNVSSHTSGSVSKLIQIVGTIHIDPSGFVHFLAYADASDGTTASVINTDYVELNVELSTDVWSSAKPQWVNATLQNSWVEFDATQTPKYELGKDGFVELIGAVKSGTLGSTMMTLPTGYRPIKQFTGLLAGNDGNIYRISISTAGIVTVTQSVGSGGNSFVSLDGIRFPVA
ncbi:pyocin knob domain-containing protein [Exiguobacterium sp. s78]|uniref:pyocin knob domain-containing protein n=1 Tax=Exiguobacterium sp. s78 TaxID=2751197 RepID=UPI001BE9BB9D|nr:pyocin knob domain-containing protein [Exiguobacterium sp. s78]